MTNTCSQRLAGLFLIIAILTTASPNACFGQTISGTIKDLRGLPLSLAQLNANLAAANLAPLGSAAEFQARLRIAATPRGASVLQSVAFDPGTGVFSIVFSAVDPVNQAVDVTISAAGLLDPVQLTGLAIENQTVNPVMPLATTQRYSCCRCSHRRCRR
jgi:hypothetical protein